jgi:hypothetical protein
VAVSITHTRVSARPRSRATKIAGLRFTILESHFPLSRGVGRDYGVGRGLGVALGGVVGERDAVAVGVGVGVGVPPWGL